MDPWSVSPASLIENVPRTLSVTFAPKRFFETLARAPSDAAIAFRTTCAAAAAYGVYGSMKSGLYLAWKSDTKVAPAPVSWSVGTPATDAYRESDALPALVIVWEFVKPSGRSSFTFWLSPSTATLSLISWPPFS